jgi:hypothetical protein
MSEPIRHPYEPMPHPGSRNPLLRDRTTIQGRPVVFDEGWCTWVSIPQGVEACTTCKGLGWVEDTQTEVDFLPCQDCNRTGRRDKGEPVVPEPEARPILPARGFDL